MNDSSVDITSDKKEISGFSGIKSSLKEYLGHLKLFSRNARLYLTGMFLIWTNFQIFNLLLNLYLKELGFDESTIGLVNSSRAVGMSIMAIPAALILTRIRLKPVLVVGAFLLAGFSFVMSSSEVYRIILLASALNGAMLAFYRVAAGPFFMRNSTEKERTHLFSASFATLMVAGMLASSGSGELVELIGHHTGNMITGFRYTLYVGIGVSLFALIPILKIKAAPPSPNERKLNFSRQQLKERGKFYFQISFVNFLLGLGAGLIIPFLNLYFRDRFNLNPDTIGWFYFVVTMFMVIGTMSGPLLARKLGLVRTVVLTQLISIPFMLVLSYSYVLPLVFAAFVIRGGLMNLGAPISTNIGMELSQKSEQGLVNALLMLSWTSAWMFSTAIGGSLIEAYGYTVTMNITIVLYVFSSVIYYVFFGKVEKRNEGVPGWSFVQEYSSK